MTYMLCICSFKGVHIPYWACYMHNLTIRGRKILVPLVCYAESRSRSIRGSLCYILDCEVQFCIPLVNKCMLLSRSKCKKGSGSTPRMGPEGRQNTGVDPGPFLSISTRLDMSIKCSAWCSASLKAAHAKKY